MVPLIITLLVIVAIVVQIAAFFVTLRIRRRLAASDEAKQGE